MLSKKSNGRKFCNVISQIIMVEHHLNPLSHYWKKQKFFLQNFAPPICWRLSLKWEIIAKKLVSLLACTHLLAFHSLMGRLILNMFLKIRPLILLTKVPLIKGLNNYIITPYAMPIPVSSPSSKKYNNSTSTDWIFMKFSENDLCDITMKFNQLYSTLLYYTLKLIFKNPNFFQT